MLVQEAKNPPCAAAAALKSWDEHWHSCPGKWWSLHPWKGSKAAGMWHLGTWVRGGLGSAGGTVGLDELRINLNDSVILFFQTKEEWNKLYFEEQFEVLTLSPPKISHSLVLLIQVFSIRLNCTYQGVVKIKNVLTFGW